MCVSYWGWQQSGIRGQKVRELADELGVPVHMVNPSTSFFDNATILKASRIAIIWNGFHATTMQARAACRTLHIPYLMMELGILPQRESFLVDPSGFNCESSLHGPLEWVTGFDMMRLYQERDRLCAKYPIDPQGHVLAVCQVENDTAMLYNHPQRNIGDFVRDLAIMYPQQEVVIRPHPKVKKEIKPRNPLHRVESEGDIFEAASKASIVVGVTSTCLIEAAVLGVPVLALGNHPFRTHGRHDHDRLAAAFLSRRLGHDERLLPLVERLGLISC
jgi:capsule polysaccharide export protein KpsC/LpsZ